MKVIIGNFKQDIIMRNTNFIREILYITMLFFTSIFSYSQNADKKDITLTILKDSIENNSLVMVEFFNHSNTNYYLPLDTSMDRYLGFNSYYESVGDFSLKEIWYDNQMDIGGGRGTDTSDCMNIKQGLFADKSSKKEKEFTNVTLLLLKSNTAVRIQLPIKFIKREFYSCMLFYQSTDYLFTYFQVCYQVTNEKMGQLKKKVNIIAKKTWKIKDINCIQKR
ncbi:hypothetical protein QNH98_05740 [Myroides sp. mNGS23_01]|nr:hypothetical protein [Myroides sp. mNGS23_01]WHT40125.1 hypothetical protein QNH98_05740 [Myroides sp. mNGS23_01]